MAVDACPGVVADQHPQIQLGRPIDGAAEVGQRLVEPGVRLDLDPAIEAVEREPQLTGPIREPPPRFRRDQLVVEPGRDSSIESKPAARTARQIDSMLGYS